MFSSGEIFKMELGWIIRTLLGFALLGVIAMIFALLLYLFESFSPSAVKREAIERGYAIYCPENGKWSWKDECLK